MAYPAPLEALVDAFARLPGVGRRTAERLALHILRDPGSRILARAIETAVRDTTRCKICRNVCEDDPCDVCADQDRDASRVLVVEEPSHVESVERAEVWPGRYHVLMGSYNPAEGGAVQHLGIGGLVERLNAGAREGGERIEEIVLGMDPDKEGEATLLLVLEAIESTGVEVRVTRLARGLPAGSGIEYLHKGVLEDAIEDRRPLRRR
ncbi:MAG: toprim domain-containing protein [Planctomycetota bacterium]|nr:toprim domain-containing protein [Planctomycetota bacterium]